LTGGGGGGGGNGGRRNDGIGGGRSASGVLLRFTGLSYVLSWTGRGFWIAETDARE